MRAASAKAAAAFVLVPLVAALVALHVARWPHAAPPRQRPVAAGRLADDIVRASLQLPLAHLFNNKAFNGDYDGSGRSFPQHELPPGLAADPLIVNDRVAFNASAWAAPGNDNVVAYAQTLRLPQPVPALSLEMLASAESRTFTAPLAVTYADGSEQLIDTLVPHWINYPYPPRGEVRLPYHQRADGTRDYNTSHVHAWSAPLDTSRRVAAIRLPDSRSAGAGSGHSVPGQASALAKNELHVFALSLLVVPPPGAAGASSKLRIVEATCTSRYTPEGQVVDVVVANTRPRSLRAEDYVLERDAVYVTLESDVLQVRHTAPVARLAPGEQLRVPVCVARRPGVAEGALGDAVVKVVAAATSTPLCQARIDVVAGERAYDAAPASLAAHSSPAWFDGAKFGIFIHWGPYAVPGWAPVGRQYAEWYWWDQHVPGNASSPTWAHHKEVWGEDFVYDDFFQLFDGAEFDARAWLELIADAGARYFVLTTKHHDGYALFDTGATSRRNSLHIAPAHGRGRDYLRELFDTAQREFPALHRGTYFSVPEWFHPDYEPYGFGPDWERVKGLLVRYNWPGGLARNAYDSSRLEPYTGYVAVDDFVRDVALEQMRILAYEYDTEIMWCDIGGPNRSYEFAAEWYNWARAQGRHVTMNDRCGVVESDFDTPEYATYPGVRRRKWEASAGVDPFSYGYNRATRPEEYQSSRALVHQLVDIVSKNGNFLLDIGPDGHGRVPAAQAERLRDIGAWLRANGEAIYDTEPWSVAAQTPDGRVRFTRNAHALYILVLDAPAGPHVFVRGVYLPILRDEDTIELLAPPTGVAIPVAYALLPDGALALDVTNVSGGEHVWTFRVCFGCARNKTSSAVPAATGLPMASPIGLVAGLFTKG